MSLTPEELAEARAVVASLNDRAKETLRSMIEAAIAAADNPSEAALAVCVLLEREIGLAGNGWFDDDDAVLAAI